MNESSSTQESMAGASREEITSALFASLVMQQTNMALMFLGKVAHPDTGKTVKDVEAAKYFIDLLEMLEARTRGNLSKEEGQLLKQSLMTVRMSFVEAVDSTESKPSGAAAEGKPDAPGDQSAPSEPQSAKSNEHPAEAEETHKKFSKKY